MIGIVSIIVSALVLEKNNFDNEIPRSGSEWKEYLKGIFNCRRNLGNDGIRGGYRDGRMMISLEERYENFKKTIQECGSYLLTESDDTIKYNLFEEFSIDVISFLHEDTLNLFLNEGMIDDDI